VTGAARRLAAALDLVPVVLLAVIAGAGSFTHICDTAARHGQHGPMSWAIAVSVDLTCVMAARERQRDKRLAIAARRLSWPVLVLAGGVLLSLSADLAQAQPTAWGQVMAAVPCAAFLVISRRVVCTHRARSASTGAE
jgi:amino acid transporter